MRLKSLYISELFRVPSSDIICNIVQIKEETHIKNLMSTFNLIILACVREAGSPGVPGASAASPVVGETERDHESVQTLSVLRLMKLRQSTAHFAMELLLFRLT